MPVDDFIDEFLPGSNPPDELLNVFTEMKTSYPNEKPMKEDFVKDFTFQLPSAELFTDNYTQQETSFRRPRQSNIWSRNSFRYETCSQLRDKRPPLAIQKHARRELLRRRCGHHREKDSIRPNDFLCRVQVRQSL